MADLTGIRVLISRPEPSASKMAQQLARQGALCQILPAILIKSIVISPQLKQQFLDLDQFHHIIAISQNAVRFGLELIDTYWPQLPASTCWYGLGDATTHAFKQYDIISETPAINNAVFDTEALLQHNLLQQLQKQKILILKGKGGRSLLTETLCQRGAKVTEAELYERCLPSYSTEMIKERIIRFLPHFVIALSGDTVENLFLIAESHSNIDTAAVGALQQSTWILPSERVATKANQYGLRDFFIPRTLAITDIIQLMERLKPLITNQEAEHHDLPLF